jgi:3-dehydroquinate synthase
MNLSLLRHPASPVKLAPLHQAVTVTFQYAVHFTSALFDLENPLLAQVVTQSAAARPRKCMFVVDGGLIQAQPDLLTAIQAYCDRHSPAIDLRCDPWVISGGESVKNDPQQVEQLQHAIHTAGICRHSYVIAIGGGAALDMIGYAAATAHRGIRLVRVPSTVLAQGDSGVGVKNSVNAFGKKNFLGTFTPPYAVINDAAFLTGLTQRDWIGGVAEAVKVALIRDGAFFRFLETNAKAIAQRDPELMQQVIYRSCQHHLQHIGNSGDPFEMGSSRPLDFGHWAAHRLEYLTDYRLRHGEAVAIGMAIDSTYAYLQGWLPQAHWQRIITTLQNLGLPTFAPELKAVGAADARSVFRGLLEFQEHLGGELTIAMIDGIGSCFDVHQVDISLFQAAIDLLEDL